MGDGVRGFANNTEAAQDYAASSAIPTPASVDRALIDALDDAVLVYDLDTTLVVDVNAAACTLFGIARDQLLGRALGSLSAGGSGFPRERVFQIVEQTAQDLSAELEWPCRRADGSEFWAELRARRTRGPGPARLVAIVRDVSAIRAARNSLRMAEERYRLLVRGIPDTAVILCDQSLRLVLVDGPEVSATGFSKEAMEGRTIYEALPADFVPLVENNIRRVLAGESFSAEIPFGEGWYRYNYVPIKDDNGAVVWAMIMALNVTAHRRVVAALEASEARSRGLAEATFEGIAVTSRGRVLDANDQLLRMFGVTRDQMVGQEIMKFVAPESRDFVRNHLQSASSEPYEHMSLRPDGTTFAVEVRARSAGEGDRPVRISAVRDVTDRRRADAERDRLITELSARNSEMEQFTYTVSHDLKSPLVTITGFLGMLEHDIAAGDQVKVKDDLARIGSAAQRMLSLLGDLLELSRAGRVTGQVVSVSLNDVVQEVCELLAADLSRRSVTLKVAPDLGRVQGDRLRLLQVVQNLLENAIKYLGEQPDPVVEIGLRPHPGKIVCFVRDNGIGIDPKYAERIFGLFEKLDPKSPGSGVGLALVRRILESHGGRVWVESDGAAGSTFLCELPRENCPAPPL